MEYNWLPTSLAPGLLEAAASAGAVSGESSSEDREGTRRRRRQSRLAGETTELAVSEDKPEHRLDRLA